MRIKLLDRLREGAATVGELQQATGGSQQNVSKHLGVLLSAGLVSRTKEGTFSRYAIADASVFALCEQVCGGLRRQLSELDAILRRLHRLSRGGRATAEAGRARCRAGVCGRSRTAARARYG